MEDRELAAGRKRIRLIEPKAPGLHVFSRILLPRLGLPIMGAILKQKGFDVGIYCEDIQEIDYEDVFRSDLVGISTTTSTAPRSYALADDLRERGIPVVLGGSHATFCPDEALVHAPFCVRGEGEDVFPLLIETVLGGGSPVGLPGVSCVQDGRVVHNPPGDRIEDLDSLPVPDLSLIHGHQRMAIRPVMTSRGCPFDCTFCSVTEMFGRRYRTRSVEGVIEEIVAARPDGIFFYDDNFAANRERAKKLCEGMVRKGIRANWGAQVRVDAAEDEELLKLMRRSGCRMLYIGLESVNPGTLNEFHKRQSVGDIEECVRKLHKHDIMVHGMFIAGADEDDEGTVNGAADFAMKNGIETMQISALTPFPGTRLFAELLNQGRILFKDWSLYDGHHVVFEPRKMTPSALQKASLHATERFYTLWQCLKELFRFRFVCAFLRYYGNRQTKRWAAANRAFIESLSRFHRTQDL